VIASIVSLFSNQIKRRGHTLPHHRA